MEPTCSFIDNGGYRSTSQVCTPVSSMGFWPTWTGEGYLLTVHISCLSWASVCCCSPIPLSRPGTGSAHLPRHLSVLQTMICRRQNNTELWRTICSEKNMKEVLLVQRRLFENDGWTLCSRTVISCSLVPCKEVWCIARRPDISIAPKLQILTPGNLRTTVICKVDTVAQLF